MRAMIRVFATLVLAGFGSAVAQNRPAHELLRIDGSTTFVRNDSGLKVSVEPGFEMTGPHSFSKQEDNGFHFEVSLESYVSANALVSVVAERLVESDQLNYEELPAAKWPDSGFLLRASGCKLLTPEEARTFSAESGMSWILDAGFEADGSYAFEASLLVASDKIHEATIELIAPVKTCDDAVGIESALASLRKRVSVSRSRRQPDHVVE
jgi:hypothetical protein